MNREILFRGKRTDNNAWVYGDIAQHSTSLGYWFISNKSYTYQVIPKTVGQYTGLKDKNGREIYEGDIVITAEFTRAVKGEVVYSGSSFVVEVKGSHSANIYGGRNTEIIGNIFDNPDLLKE